MLSVCHAGPLGGSNVPALAHVHVAPCIHSVTQNDITPDPAHFLWIYELLNPQYFHQAAPSNRVAHGNT
ncbi:hypothetical protein COCMIDRAFT_107672 [Bipolaris oryzae ATCC 44560]|uniref:Uncharacterized protein n=1 Tax=Bipolaris oryzae ATCC 44560 TaxID=930090 RepID=W6YTE0_COCMI|nr:uncharacterized protein COCMIDRAFT_107672 [Bipolaris oryzae ATCC 44560]EUC40865.1 hypothetical protein COCMIDRAFT_107672 [Bipolaris oryzae ATCC 44560]